MQIKVKEKTGFVSNVPFIIFDLRGVEFYSDKFVNHKPVYFNLPKGEYLLKGKIHRLKNPVPFREIKLPKPNRILPKEKFKITFGDNPNKATVFHGKGIILFDNVFETFPLYILYFIYFHELGHRFYNGKNEDLADKYARKRMLEIGFNKSQIGFSNVFTLRSNKFGRQSKALTDLSNAQL